MKQKFSIRNRELISPQFPHREVPVSRNNNLDRYLEISTQFSLYLPAKQVASLEDYFEFQHQTSKTIFQVKKAITTYYFSQFQDVPELNPSLMHLNVKSEEKVFHRGSFSRMCSIALNDNDQIKFLTLIGAGIEFLLDSMYYINQVYDSKSKPNLVQNITAFEHAKELSFSIARGVLDDTSLFEKSIAGFMYGEYIDCLHNVFDRLKNSSSEHRLNSCDKRMYYINTLFYQAVPQIVGNLLMRQGNICDKSRLEALTQYAHYFGMGFQIVNDIADFVPSEFNLGTREKTPQDSYRDIQNKKMTYPVIAMLEMALPNDREKVIACLEKGFQSSQEELREVTDIFIRSGAYAECRAICRKYKTSAQKLAREFNPKAHSCLSNQSIILDSNRYYSALNALREQMKGGERK